MYISLLQLCCHVFQCRFSSVASPWLCNRLSVWHCRSVSNRFTTQHRQYKGHRPNLYCKWSFIASDRGEISRPECFPPYIVFWSRLKQSNTGFIRTYIYHGPWLVQSCRSENISFTSTQWPNKHVQLSFIKYSITITEPRYNHADIESGVPLHVAALVINVMAYFLVKRTTHPSSLRHGFYKDTFTDTMALIQLGK